jgi:uncharacterized protein
MSRQLCGTLILSFCACAISVPANSASFDCKTAKHSNEKLICQSTELSALDDKMADLFTKVSDLLGNRDHQQVKDSQKNWLKERLDCDDDFLCTKSAYSERIERLNSVLTKLTDKASNAKAAAVEQCRVADPNPPLNVRTTPNGSIVGSLSNDTVVSVLDYSANKQWIFVGRYEDRSPIGWAFGEYLDCRANVGSGDWSFLSFRDGLTGYDCYLGRKFPETPKQDKDPVVGTTVVVPYDEKRERFLGMEVNHRLQSGAIHKRHEQYRDYKTSVKTYDESVSWKWTGVLAINRALSMKGEMTGGEGDENYYYSEELTANGQLDWVGIWSCREHHLRKAN